MKIVYVVLVFALISALSMAQSSKGFSFQGYARGADGAALQNELNLEVKFTMFSSNEGNPEFTEDQILTTNEFGVFQTVIGVVNTSDFDALDFASFDYTLKVEVKDNGNYQTVAKKILLAVPYAKAAESSTRSVVADQVKAGSNGVPPGTIVAFAGSTPPQGWVICNGGAYNGEEEKYKDLYNVITTVYGGTGSTSFNVPDFRGVFPRGLDGGKGIDAGRTLGSLQEDALKSHNHSGTAATGGRHRHDIDKLPTDQKGSSDIYSLFNTTGSDEGWSDVPSGRPYNSISEHLGHTHTLNIDATGGSETRPKNIAVNYIIKL